jgi:aryl-phospho-beta-D-glucosidase BglC (GH1 family)
VKNLNNYKKGINLGGWLSQCHYEKKHFDTFITEKDIQNIASMGADHIRLPIDYNVIENDDGFVESGFEYIDQAMIWCQKNALNLVLDLHKTPGYSFDDGENENGFFDVEEYQKHFFQIWQKLAARYSKYGEHIIFELLNEVTEKKYCTKWNKIAHTCIQKIREIAPDIIILVGGYGNNSVEAVKDLDPPYDDKIVYNFHCYDLLHFTHQGAYWVKDMAPDYRESFSESGVTKAFFRQLFHEACEYAKKNNTVLYCGEYGVIHLAAPADRLKWQKDIHDVFEEENIGRAAWSYREMDFGITDREMNSIRNEFLKYL